MKSISTVARKYCMQPDRFIKTDMSLKTYGAYNLILQLSAHA